MSLTLTYPSPSLILLVGPSGSGKSTFAAQHFAPTEIISSDRCRAMICDDEASQTVNEDAFALLYYWLELRLKNRRFTVVDSTALKPGTRDHIAGLAAKYHVPLYALALDVPLDECLRRDAVRPGRQVGEKVITRHHAQFDNAKRELARDKRLAGFQALTLDEIATVQIRRGNPSDMGRQFDVIGDVHGCWLELGDLWERLGYVWENGLPVHPDGRLPVFVGDLADRGPDSVSVLQTVAALVAAGKGLFAPGNHDDKLFRLLQGRNVTRSHGLAGTEEQINALAPDIRERLVGAILSCLATAPPYLTLDGGNLVVAHAGIREEMIGQTSGRVREFTLYGDVRGFEPGTNKPIRYDWAQEYTGSALIAYGHTPQEKVQFVGNTLNPHKDAVTPRLGEPGLTINLDGGCVFGGNLCALRYPELEIVSVPARQVYAYHEGLSYSHPVGQDPINSDLSDK